MVSVSFNSSITDEPSETKTTSLSGAPEFTLPVFSGVRVTQSVVFGVVLCRSVVFLWSDSFGHSIIRLFFFDLRSLITPLGFSNFSYFKLLVMLYIWLGVDVMIYC